MKTLTFTLLILLALPGRAETKLENALKKMQAKTVQEHQKLVDDFYSTSESAKSSAAIALCFSYRFNSMDVEYLNEFKQAGLSACTYVSVLRDFINSLDESSLNYVSKGITHSIRRMMVPTFPNIELANWKGCSTTELDALFAYVEKHSLLNKIVGIITLAASYEDQRMNQYFKRLFKLANQKERAVKDRKKVLSLLKSTLESKDESKTATNKNILRAETNLKAEGVKNPKSYSLNIATKFPNCLGAINQAVSDRLKIEFSKEDERKQKIEN